MVLLKTRFLRCIAQAFSKDCALRMDAVTWNVPQSTPQLKPHMLQLGESDGGFVSHDVAVEKVPSAILLVMEF